MPHGYDPRTHCSVLGLVGLLDETKVEPHRCHIKTGKQIQQHGLKMRKKEVKASVGTKERTWLQWTDGIVVVINL